MTSQTKHGVARSADTKKHKEAAPLAAIRNAIATAKADKQKLLPHVNGFKWYTWAREFYESTRHMNLLCAGNQASKSSTNIRKCIDWATDKKKWTGLWPKNPEPRIFFYFYPSSEVATIEFEKKWTPEFMPRGEMKDHPVYGWTPEYERRYISAVHFNSGVSIYFKTYQQRARNLQTATVHAVFGDEEMPPELYDEIDARLSATEGYLNLVFTATEGHEIWYQALERQGEEDETFVDARKWMVSLYDCQFYEDGSPGAWDIEKIKTREARCSTENERLKRVMGRFIKDVGLKYSSFSASRNIVQPFQIEPDWQLYSAVDVGSGGKSKDKRSMAAIVFLAVNPEFSKGSVFKMWRGDGVETSAGDIYEKWLKLSSGISLIGNCYDYNSREFGIIATRNSSAFVRADKTRGAGEQTLNTLFKHGMITIQAVDDHGKLLTELLSVPSGEKKRKVADDLTDALRYCVMQVPWDWTKIPSEDITARNIVKKEVDRPLTEEERYAMQIKARRGEADTPLPQGWEEMEREFAYWNDQYGA